MSVIQENGRFSSASQNKRNEVWYQKQHFGKSEKRGPLFPYWIFPSLSPPPLFGYLRISTPPPLAENRDVQTEKGQGRIVSPSSEMTPSEFDICAMNDEYMMTVLQEEQLTVFTAVEIWGCQVKCRTKQNLYFL